MRTLVALIAVVVGGCLHDDLVKCGDISCPVGYGCDADHGVCIDPFGLAVSSDDVDLLDVPCGGSKEATVIVTNFGASELTFSAVTTLEGVIASPAMGVLVPGEASEIVVTATAPSDSIPNLAVEGSLLIATDVEVINRPVRMSTRGGVLSASVSQLDFGEATQNNIDTRSFTLQNDGNAPIELALSTQSPAFTLASEEAITIPPNSSIQASVAFEPTQLQSYMGKLSLASGSSLCQSQPPSSIELTGVATLADVLVDHLTLDFGADSCSVPIEKLPLIVTNNTDATQTLTMSLDPGASELFEMPTPTTVAPHTMTTLLIARRSIGVTTIGTHGGILTIDASGGTTKTIVLKQLIVAPVLVPPSLNVNFTDVPTNMSFGMILQISNTGNVIGNAVITPPSRVYTDGASASISPPMLQLPIGNSQLMFSFESGTIQGAAFDDTFVITAPGACSGPVVVNFFASVN